MSGIHEGEGFSMHNYKHYVLVLLFLGYYAKLTWGELKKNC